MNLTQSIILFLPALIAGIIQGTTGFGFGIIVMLIYPHILGVIPSAGISQCVSAFLCLFMVVQYRKHIQWNLLVKPWIIYFPSYFAFIWFVTQINVNFLRPVLGVFLVLLSLYFLRFSSNIVIRDRWESALICVLLGAAVDAAFGIGGPPVVLYLMSVTKSKEEYLGTIQAFFFVTCVYGTCMRMFNGMLPADIVPALGISLFGMFIGVSISVKIVARLDSAKVKHIVYYIIGVAGMITLLNHFISEVKIWGN